MRTAVACGTLVAALVSYPAAARAQSTADAKERARSSYSRGENALEREDYATAADEFLRADAALPSSAAKKAALEAAARTDDAGLGARALNRAAAHYDEVFAAAQRLLEAKVGPKLARMRVDCRATTCAVTLEGVRFDDRETRWLTAGRHVASTAIDGVVGQRTVDAVAGTIHTLTLSAPVAQVPRTIDVDSRPRPAEAGISPVWFFSGAGLSVIAGGLATWSTVDLLSRRSEYKDQRCASSFSPGCQALAADGKSADARTAILWGVAGLLAATTVVTGIVLVRWHDERVSIVASSDGASIGLGGSLR